MSSKEDVKSADGQVHGSARHENVPQSRLFPSARMTVTIMMLFACLLTYVLRLNMGFAMVCMMKSSPAKRNMSTIVSIDGVNNSEFLKNANYSNPPLDKCNPEVGDHLYFNSSQKPEEAGEFEWEKSLQGALLGAFFYGYIFTQVPAGWLCDRFGGKVVLGTGLGVVSLLTLLLPESARLDPYAMLAVRAIQGIFAAVSFPAIHSIIGNWAPPTEVGLLMAISYSGMYGGTLLTFPICGLLCKYGFAGGWPSVFYVTGMFGIVFVTAMIFLVYDGYEKHPRISSKERLYLKTTLIGHHEAGTQMFVPWMKLCKSKPVWAMSIAHLCCNWGLYTLVINLPLFMKEVLKFDIKQNGFLSSLPYLASLIVNLFAGKLTDFLRRREILTLTTLRKVLNTIGMVIPAFCMLAITFMDCTQRYLVVGAVTAVQAMSGFAYSGGFFYNHVDISPRHAGILMGITNTFGTIPGILSPLLVGVFTPNGTEEEWSIIFYIGFAMYLVGGVFYAVFASGERQEWSYTPDEIKEQLELKHDNS